MPLYEVFFLAQPHLAKSALAELIKRSCNTVISGDGVITKIVSNGVIPLCHTIKKTHGHYSEVWRWQCV
jgi:ribosomal protein S6